ncbi:flagellar hook-length control protein FliK [Propionispora hippei]|uniref:Hook-length control protein FliK n=1 Tax=Propionispora hippei DSM 15287 TaxID=1123003 RepID=A0A1M6D3E8_9FIRM|nr:flagellar hook-length control protein FliK [Propionispora hippei]SHI67518.1 hook-length control protein FliK [Propionispora hippei DSM 15287]
MEATINVLPGAAATPQQALPAGSQASAGTGAKQGNAFAGMLQNATVKDADTGQKIAVPSGLTQLAFLAQLAVTTANAASGEGATGKAGSAAQEENETAASTDSSTAGKEQATVALMGLVLPMLPVQPTATTPEADAGGAATTGENKAAAVVAKQEPVITVEPLVAPTTEKTQTVAATDKDKPAVAVTATQPQSFAEAIQQNLTNPTKPEKTDAGTQAVVLPAGDEKAATVAVDAAKAQTASASMDFPVQTVHVMSTIDNKSFVKGTEQPQPVPHAQAQEPVVQPVANLVQGEAQQGMNQGQPEEQTAFSDGTKHQAEDVADLNAKNNTVSAVFTQLADSQTVKTATTTQTAAHAQQPAADPYNLSGQIVEQAKLIKTPYNDASEMVIKLKPEHLGELTLRVAVEHGEVTASFHTNNPEVRGIIENSLPQLKQDMASQGIKVDNVGVYAGLSQFDSRGQQANQQQPVIKLKNRKTDDDFIATVESLQAEQTGSDTGVDYRV